MIVPLILVDVWAWLAMAHITEIPACCFRHLDNFLVSTWYFWGSGGQANAWASLDVSTSGSVRSSTRCLSNLLVKEEAAGLVLVFGHLTCILNLQD